MGSARPNREELAAAVGATVPDVIAPRLDVLFCGINPGLWSGAVGHHFAHPGNRFWKAIAAAGFTDDVLAPSEQQRLTEFGVGITNLVDVATRAAADLTSDQLRAGGARLEEKVRTTGPKAVVFLGLTAYRSAFRCPDAKVGLQDERIGDSALWVLPNPSGLQAHYPYSELVDQLKLVRASLGAHP